MKRTGLLLVALVGVSLVALSGTVITNDTDHDATGLRVTFSSPVLITSFGNALTSVEPQMISYEFVFTGGTVKPWDSQWFNYAPATASAVSTEWLAVPQEPPTGHGGVVVAEPADVEIEYLGNPFSERLPDGSRWEHARAVWDMEVFGNQIYLAHGSIASNAGPIDIWRYDPDNGTFLTDFTVDEESVWSFVDGGDTLLIVGPDATESWDWGNVYTFNGMQWVKHRNLPNVTHGYSGACHAGLLYASGGRTLVDAQGNRQFDDEVFVSSDGGVSWTMLVRNQAVSAICLFELGETLYACDAFGHGVLRYTGSSFESIPEVSMFPGVPVSEQGIGMQVSNWVEFGGCLVYFGSGLRPDGFPRTPLYVASAIDAESITAVPLGASTEIVTDIVTAEGACWVLTNELHEDEVAATARIYASRSLKSWEAILTLESPTLVQSFEILDDSLYLGLGPGHPQATYRATGIGSGSAFGDNNTHCGDIFRVDISEVIDRLRNTGDIRAMPDSDDSAVASAAAAEDFPVRSTDETSSDEQEGTPPEDGDYSSFASVAELPEIPNEGAPDESDTEALGDSPCLLVGLSSVGLCVDGFSQDSIQAHQYWFAEDASTGGRGVSPLLANGLYSVLYHYPSDGDVKLALRFEPAFDASAYDGVQVTLRGTGSLAVTFEVASQDEAVSFANPDNWKSSWLDCELTIPEEATTVQLPFARFTDHPWDLAEYPGLSGQVNSQAIWEIEFLPTGGEGTLEVLEVSFYSEHGRDGTVVEYEADFAPAQLAAIDGFSAGSIPIGWWYSVSRVDGEWRYTELGPQDGGEFVTYRYPQDGTSGWLHLQMNGPADLSGYDGLEIELRATPLASVALELHTGCSDADEWVQWGLDVPIECGPDSTVLRVPFSALSVIDEGESDFPASTSSLDCECVRVVAFILEEEGIELTIESVHVYELGAEQAASANDPHIEGLEYVGNPFKGAFPDGSGMEGARSVYDMHVWDGRLYLGHGDATNNAGPITVWFYDPALEEFFAEFIVDEEVIRLFREVDGNLYIPGADATESHEMGNLYVNEAGSWTKLRTLQRAVHVLDVGMMDEWLLAAGECELDGGMSFGGAVYLSSDEGMTWTCYVIRSTIPTGAGDFDPANPDVYRFTHIILLGERRYVVGIAPSRIYEITRQGLLWVDVDLFPESGVPSRSDCSSLAGATMMEHAESVHGQIASVAEASGAYGPCFGGGPSRDAYFLDQLVYIGKMALGDCLGLYAATEMSQSGIRKLGVPTQADQLDDLLVYEDRLYLLANSQQEDGSWICWVLSTSDLKTWMTEFEFYSPAHLYSFEILSGLMYFGVRGDDEFAGNVYRTSTQ